MTEEHWEEITSMKELGSKLTLFRKQAGISQKQVASHLETTQGMISRYENGFNLIDPSHLTRWLDFLNIDKQKAALLTVDAARMITEDNKIQKNRSEMISLPEFGVVASAGGGEFVGFEEVVEYHNIPEKFLPDMTHEKSGIVRINGDSMYPTINSGDHVVVSLTGSFYEDGIYLIRIDNSVYCKRLQRRINGIFVISDNPAYSEIEITSDDSDCFAVLGKVVLTLKKH